MSSRRSLAVLSLLMALSFQAAAQTRATVRSEGTRLLKEPTQRSSLLKSLDAGAQLDVEDAFLDKHWTKVNSNNTHGWVRRENIWIAMDDPWKNAVWLFIGSTPKLNGFVARFYLNTSQIIRLGDNIRFWTKTIPDNRKAYFKFIMDIAPARKPSEFRFNSDLWEGDCESDEIRVRRSLLYWRTGDVTRPNVNVEDDSTRSDSAARVILREACKAALR